MNRAKRTHTRLAAIVTFAMVVVSACTSGTPTAAPPATVTVTAAAPSANAPTTPTPTKTKASPVTPPTKDMGDENNPTDTVPKGKIGTPLLVVDPVNPENTITINVFRVDRVTSDDPDLYSPHKASGFLSISMTIRVKTGVWETSPLDWTLDPDADTGTPLYQPEGSVGRYDSDGDDRALYDGKVRALKHVEGGVYFDAPIGSFTLRYTPTFYMFYSDDGIASWRVHG